MARLQQGKQAAVTTGRATKRPPPRNGFTVSFVLSLGIGVLAPIARASRHSIDSGLDLSVERPGPHDFAVRAGQALVQRRRHVHRSPPHVRDDASVPLLEAGWRKINMISEK
ncbi:conserved protein of unknown function [Bradyrhizobium sp. ORS 285]|nr:conserved protein of unknown function [Bradyrhizobium sp. ORS 285]